MKIQIVINSSLDSLLKGFTTVFFCLQYSESQGNNADFKPKVIVNPDYERVSSLYFFVCTVGAEGERGVRSTLTILLVFLTSLGVSTGMVSILDSKLASFLVTA